MGFFGLMQVLCGTWGPNLKGAWVTGLLHSGFCTLLLPGSIILPRHMLPELLSPALMWSLLYPACKTQVWWPCWWEIILVSTLPCCTQDFGMELSVFIPGLVPASVCQSHLNLIFRSRFLPWQSISHSLSYCGDEAKPLDNRVFLCSILSSPE